MEHQKPTKLPGSPRSAGEKSRLAYVSPAANNTFGPFWERLWKNLASSRASATQVSNLGALVDAQLPDLLVLGLSSGGIAAGASQRYARDHDTIGIRCDPHRGAGHRGGSANSPRRVPDAHLTLCSRQRHWHVQGRQGIAGTVRDGSRPRFYLRILSACTRGIAPNITGERLWQKAGTSK
jgi:hypothetical protein